MPIVSSVIQTDRPQADGRRKIVEAHTDHLGRVHMRRYLAGDGDNVSAGLVTRAGEILEGLVIHELGQHVSAVSQFGSGAVIVLVYVTAGEARSALREALRDARGIILANLAEFCLTLTNGQLQSLFGVSAGTQTTQLRSRLQAKVDKRDALLAEVGE